jgi:hypothetical protein
MYNYFNKKENPHLKNFYFGTLESYANILLKKKELDNFQKSILYEYLVNNITITRNPKKFIKIFISVFNKFIK